MQKEGPLLFLSALGKALSHKVRTPLSVIVNDLAYLRASYPEADIDRAGRKCEEISLLLSGVAFSLTNESAKEALLIALNNVATESLDYSIHQGSFFPSVVHRWLKDFFGIISLKDSLLCVKKEHCSIYNGKFKLKRSHQIQRGEQFHSLTRFSSEGLRSEVIVAPLLDLLFLDTQSKVTIKYEKEFTLTLEIPATLEVTDGA